MPNQALALHRLSARKYDLTGLRTGSIRDQLLRSSLIVSCLFDEGKINSHRRLLILGAGASGMNAAMTAAEKGVSVDVLEKNRHPFGSLFDSNWRTIDPVEYDWPQPHCTDKIFPNGGKGIPLVQSRATGATLARVWAEKWREWLKDKDGKNSRGRINLIPEVNAWDFLSFNEISDRIEVTGPWPDGHKSKAYGAILSCIGFGPERTFDDRTPTKWNDYRGPAFWSDNDGLGIGNPLPTPARHVLISGGGDGAMQDFQRATTGYCGLDLLNSLVEAANTHIPAVSIVPKEMLLDLVLAEDRGRRAHVWARDKAPPKKALEQWHESFLNAISDVTGKISSEQARSLLDEILLPSVSAGTRRVTWVHPEVVPSYAYALNRFLTIFLIGLVYRSAMSSISARPRISVEALPNYTIDQITPHHHSCGIADRCNGQMHTVELESTFGKSRTLTDVDLIIVRHGALPERLLDSGPPVPEQMTPFDFPQ
ncbi:MAG: NAD(P)-binding protein [Roseateles asaccharophilus]|uniref:NAD(P)-binding protein n=1 Tax=Roseateles asaccharophilus TaxID=582607 RepID=UPI00391D2D88